MSSKMWYHWFYFFWFININYLDNAISQDVKSIQRNKSNGRFYLQRRSFLAVFFCLILARLHPFNQILTTVPQLKFITVNNLEFARWNYLWMIMCLLTSKFHKKVLNGGYSGDSTIKGCWSLVFCWWSRRSWVVGHWSLVFGQGYNRVKFNFNAVL